MAAGVTSWDLLRVILKIYKHNSGLVQERRNSIVYALELRLSCTDSSSIQWCISTTEPNQ